MISASLRNVTSLEVEEIGETVGVEDVEREIVLTLEFIGLIKLRVGSMVEKRSEI